MYPSDFLENTRDFLKIEETLQELDFVLETYTHVMGVIWHFVIIGDLEGLEKFKPSPFKLLTVDACLYQEMPDESKRKIIFIPRHYSYEGPEMEEDNPFQVVYDDDGNVKMKTYTEIISYWEYMPSPMLQFKRKPFAIEDGKTNPFAMAYEVTMPQSKFRCKMPMLIRTIQLKD